MNVLIINAHPEPKSFTSAMKDLAVKHFEDSGNKVEGCNLYQMKFNPVGSPDDFKALADSNVFNYAKEQIIAHKNGTFADDVKKEMDKLTNADLVIFHFPLWWSSAPAILKGWFDRVLAFGFAYHPVEAKYTTGKMRGKKAMCVITTGGSSKAYSSEGENGDFDSIIYHINHGTLYYCGFDVLPYFVAWQAQLANEETRQKYLDDYKKHLENIDKLQPLY